MSSPQDDEVQTFDTDTVSFPTPHEVMDSKIEPPELISPAKDEQPLPRNANGGEVTTEEAALEHGNADERTIDDAKSQEGVITPQDKKGRRRPSGQPLTELKSGNWKMAMIPLGT